MNDSDDNELKFNRKKTIFDIEINGFESYLKNGKIKYPLEELNSFPIKLNQKSFMYLYFPQEEYTELSNFYKEDLNYYEVIDKLKNFIFAYFIKSYNSNRLSKRIEISYERKMENIKSYYSLIFEMNNNFKNKPIIKEKLKNFRNIKEDIIENINIEGGKSITFDPFSSLNEHFTKKKTIKNIQYLPKWGLSFKEEQQIFSSDDDEEYIEFIKNLNNQNLKRKKSKKISKKYENDLSYYDLLKKILTDNLPNDLRKDLIIFCLNNDNQFKPVNFEKFILYLEFFVTLFSGIQVKYYIDELEFLDMDFYCNEQNFMNLAELLHYQVQFRILTVSIYNSNSNKKEIKKKLTKKKFNNFENDKYVKQKLFELNKTHYEEYYLDKVEYFTPYTFFIKALANKYRRYDKYDNFHICSDCDNLSSYKKTYNLNCSSCFKNIDKCRMISSILEDIIDLNYLEKKLKRKSSQISKIFKFMFILQNQDQLKKYCNFNNLIKTYLIPFPIIEVKRINKIFKNVFGEEIGFYYVWISHYLIWLIFPCILGLIFFIINLFINYNKKIPILNVIFSILIILWGHFYLKSWSSNQKIYNYIWGMNTFKLDKNDDFNDNLLKISFLNYLGIKIPIKDYYNIIIKKIIILIILILFTIAIIFCNLIVFYLQKFKKNNIINELKNNYFPNNYIDVLIPILIFILRKIFSYLFEIVGKFLTNLEKPCDEEEYFEILIRKKVFFEFFNYYFNLYYIAFIKKYLGKCEYNDCYYELSNQLIIILFSDLISIFIKLFYNGFYLRNQKKIFENNILDKYINSNNTSKKYIYFTRKEFKQNDIHNLMIRMLYNFGYIMQFGVCCPISFSFMFFNILITRIINSIRMSQLLYVKTMNESKGIIIFKIQKILVFIGFFSNYGIIAYTNEDSRKFFGTSNKIFFYFVVFENFILLIMKLFNFDKKPSWFRYRLEIELKYLNKFGIRQKQLINENENEKHSKFKNIIEINNNDNQLTYDDDYKIQKISSNESN